MTSTELVIQDDGDRAPSTLFGTDDPVEVIQRAVPVAKALEQLVRKQKLVLRIGQSEHVRVEGWTLLGSMLGVFPVVMWTKPVLGDDGVKVGWEARVEARTRSGEIVGAAEAECLRSEKTWSGRDDYALRSMAQTRAVSKAMRLPLGFVMQIAGFSPTPAEEMPVIEHAPYDDGRFPPVVAVDAAGVISEAQRRRLRAIQREHGVADDALKALILEVAGVESSKLIPAVRYEAVCDAVAAAEPAGFQVPAGVQAQLDGDAA